MPDSIFIHNSHNVSNLVYHNASPTKYRRVVITNLVDNSLKQICEGIEARYDWIKFLEIGADEDHVHFLIQSVPEYSPTKIITTVKSITAKRIFAEHPEVKKELWGGSFWSDGYFVSSCGKNTNEKVIKEYVKNQGKQDSYEQILLKL
ncbi:MAG: IS200/IS605 family transposase [Thomasclavelia ramosa]|nr:IS200/IS605 family transposase [Thomasclavelia ramosa]